MSRLTKKKNEEQKKKKDVTRRRREKKRWRRRRRRKENPSTLEKRASCLGCESRTCAKPALTAKLPFSTSVFPLILSTSVCMCTRSRARVLQKVWRLEWKSFLFFPRAVSSNDQTHENLTAGQKTSIWWRPFFLMSTQEKMMRWEWEPYQYVYGCVYEVVRKMDDGRLASVVLYNFISIYYHLHLNL